jgi:hypothetical protein
MFFIIANAMYHAINMSNPYQNGMYRNITVMAFTVLTHLAMWFMLIYWLEWYEATVTLIVVGLIQISRATYQARKLHAATNHLRNIFGE